MAKAKRSSLILKLVLVAAAIYLLCVFISLQVKINAKKKELSGYNNDISVSATKKQELTDIYNAQIDEAYVEKVARDMGYVKSDEKVYESITD